MPSGASVRIWPEMLPHARPTRDNSDMTDIRRPSWQSGRQRRMSLGSWIGRGRTGLGIVAALLLASTTGACTSTTSDESAEGSRLTFADCGDLFDRRSAETMIPADRLSQLSFTCGT